MLIGIENGYIVQKGMPPGNEGHSLSEVLSFKGAIAAQEHY